MCELHECCGSLPSACHYVCRLSQPATCDKPKVSCAKRSEKTKSHKPKVYLKEKWLCQTAYTYYHVITLK